VNVDQLKPGGPDHRRRRASSARATSPRPGYETNPLEDDSLSRWQLVPLNISQLTWTR
jgi:hypothetical protein